VGLVSAISGDAPGIRRARSGSIRLIVVDDSVTARTVFSRVIEREPDFELVAQARSAEEALVLLDTVKADVILLDLEMPGMGGLNALPRLLEKGAGAQVMVVSSLTQEGAEPTVKALTLGAADTLPKPQSGGFDQDYRALLVTKIRALGFAAPSRPVPAPRQPEVPVLRKPSRQQAQVLAIGASTGGIHALGQFFAGLPARIGIPILVTQHLPASFMDAFARQVALASGREAFIAGERSLLVPDRILIAPGDGHVTVAEEGGRLVVRLNRVPASSGCMPSVDPMFTSLARTLGAQVVGVVLSGMGRDGTEGARQVVEAGGTILAQDEASCAVWGMPGAVSLAGLASSILPPAELALRVAASARVA